MRKEVHMSENPQVQFTEFLNELDRGCVAQEIGESRTWVVLTVAKHRQKRGTPAVYRAGYLINRARKGRRK